MLCAVGAGFASGAASAHRHKERVKLYEYSQNKVKKEAFVAFWNLSVHVASIGQSWRATEAFFFDIF